MSEQTNVLKYPFVTVGYANFSSGWARFTDYDYGVFHIQIIQD